MPRGVVEQLTACVSGTSTRIRTASPTLHTHASRGESTSHRMGAVVTHVLGRALSTLQNYKKTEGDCFSIHFPSRQPFGPCSSRAF